MSKDNINTNRRNFIKKGVTGLAGAAVLPSVLKAKDETPKSKPAQSKKRKFIYRALGKTGIKLPLLSMGSSYNIDMVNTALDAGVKHIFTSEIYGRGTHEEKIIKAAKGRPRDSFVLATGIYAPPLQDVRTRSYRKNVTEKIIIDAFEGSMKRLGLEYVDLYNICGVATKEDVNFEPFLKILEKLKREGKIRNIGLSTHMNEPEVIKAAVDSKVYDTVMTAYNFRQPHYKEVREAIAYAATSGVGVMTFKTQAGGYFDKERTQKINPKAALKWVLNDTNVTTVIAGFKNYEEMDAALSVMEELALTEQEKKDLKLADNSTLPGLYCQQCAKCMDQCKASFDIPSVMRSYMYAYGYQTPSQAKATLQQVGFNSDPCSNCGECSVKCSMGFNVRERVMDIARVTQVPDEFLA
ncbi:MAG: hypothetical protein GY757_51910 [bacterium]|nr:hypothetical protein [bacterium]